MCQENTCSQSARSIFGMWLLQWLYRCCWLLMFLSLFLQLFFLHLIYLAWIFVARRCHQQQQQNSDNVENLQKVKWNQVSRKQNLVDSSAIFIDKRVALSLSSNVNINCSFKIVSAACEWMRKRMRGKIHEQCENVQPNALLRIKKIRNHKIAMGQFLISFYCVWPNRNSMESNNKCEWAGRTKKAHVW